MPRIIETRCLQKYWGWSRYNAGSGDNSQWGDIDPNYDQVSERINEMVAEISAGGWEIKGVIPITGSHYHCTALMNGGVAVRDSYGGGHGYAAGYTVGVTVLAQRWIEISDEDLARRHRAKADAVLDQRRRDAGATVRNLPIQEEKRIIGASRWMWNGRVFENKSDAEAAREAEAKQAEKDVS